MNWSRFNFNLVKLSRWAGYALALLMALYIISGYGMTKGVIDPFLGRSLHDKWLPLPTFAALAFHSAVYFKLFLARRGIKDEIWLNVYILIFALVVFGFCLYLFLI